MGKSEEEKPSSLVRKWERVVALMMDFRSQRSCWVLKSLTVISKEFTLEMIRRERNKKKSLLDDFIEEIW